MRRTTVLAFALMVCGALMLGSTLALVTCQGHLATGEAAAASSVPVGAPPPQPEVVPGQGLAGAPAGGTAARLSPAETEEVVSMLEGLGYTGTKLEARVAAFQAAMGLPPTGGLDAATLELLVQQYTLHRAHRFSVAQLP